MEKNLMREEGYKQSEGLLPNIDTREMADARIDKYRKLMTEAELKMLAAFAYGLIKGRA